MAGDRQLDLLLVNPGNRSQIYQSLAAELSGIEPPVWALIMASYVIQQGFSVEILDANALELTYDETAQQIADMRPRLTAVVVYGHNPSASTQVMPGAGAVCSAIKRVAPDLKTLLVGGHVSALPETSLKEEEADFVCEGEGPQTIVGLLQALGSGRSEFEKVKGLCYWKGGELRRTPSAPLLQDLVNEVPDLPWNLLEMARYRAHNWHCFGDTERQPYAALYTTLGCPYHCSFCCIQAPFKSGEQVLGFRDNVSSYRFWSPEWVIRQIDVLVNDYNVRNIKIADEMFVLNRRHVNAICDLIIERGYDLNLWAYARVDTVKNDMTEKMKQAGVNWLGFGIESASERVRDDVSKGYQQADIFRSLEEVQSVGISVNANYIFGLPEDDLESMLATLDLAIDLNCEFANFYSSMAYPGSELYNVAVEKGWPLPQDWAGYSQHSVNTLPLPTNHLSASEVLRFRDQAFQTYYNRPKYLDMISRKFGPGTLKQIADMMSHTLERQNV